MVGDSSGAVFAAHGDLAALMARDRFGVGRKLDVSLLDSTLNVYGQRLLEWLMHRGRVRSIGTKQPWYVPHKTFQTKDGVINAGVQEDHRASTSWPGTAIVVLEKAVYAEKGDASASTFQRTMLVGTRSYLEALASCRAAGR
jgi:crotonobetainyl-CoA:carnitine CoA-transferase CaiB-like acyl-CoA transferase